MLKTLNKKISTIHGIIVLILLAIISACVILAYQYLCPEPEIAIPIIQQQTDGTVTWKTYSNSEVSFIFKYPNDWEIKEEYQYKSAACQIDPECKGVQYIFLNQINDNRLPEMGEKDKFGMAINMPQCSGIKWSELPGGNWACLFDESSEALNIYKQIKRTFQLKDELMAIREDDFLNETKDWEVYKNEVFNYKIKYPKDWLVNEKSIFKNNCYFDIYLLNRTDYWNEIEYAQDNPIQCIINPILINSVVFEKISCLEKGNVLNYDGYYAQGFRIFLWDLKAGQPSPEEYLECEEYFNKMLSTFRFIN